MAMPKLKRINVSSERELDAWLTKNASHIDSVMVVTHTKITHQRYVSREEVGQVLTKHGWSAGLRYTLSTDLLGHVINKKAA